MFLRRPILAVSLLGLVFVSACTTTSQGEPQPETTTESSTSDSNPGTSSGNDELPYAGAPEVDNPLETSRYKQDPCQALTAAQTQPLNLPATGEIMDNVALGTGCQWRNPDTRGYAQIVFAKGSQDGLSSEYQANEDGKWGLFEELPEIEGYPAVIRDGIDDRAAGSCIVVVGTSDNMVFESIVQLSQANVGQADPCEVSVQIAGLALQTIKEGA